MKIRTILIILLILIQISKQDCIRQLKESNSLLKRNHQNVLSYQSGALISSKIINYFRDGNDGVCLRDRIYKIMTIGVPHTQCGLGKQISIKLLQKYLLNTVKIWFWDYGSLFNQNKEKIKFMKVTQQQFVDEFELVNIGGNTYNQNLHIIKVEAYYKFQ
ncbi:unnamed protein product [Paramecium pentaurelia]|uniref:Uncharacterized protein n=1 Tax=Paramecium pentaurelia TaxID=43138 RepID=A0A8S1YPY2_9CILI|nr:unnamed protein product [Paramecium pentaurelia]